MSQIEHITARLAPWSFTSLGNGMIRVTNQWAGQIEYGPAFGEVALAALCPKEAALLDVKMAFYAQGPQGMNYYLLLSSTSLASCAPLVSNLANASNMQISIIHISYALDCVIQSTSCIESFKTTQIWLRLPTGYSASAHTIGVLIP